MEPYRIALTREWPEPGAWTYEDWLTLPSDGTRYEVIDGVLYVTPAPSMTHQAVVANLFTAMSNYVRIHEQGNVYPAPADVLLPTQPVPFEPDIIFVAKEHRDIIRSQRIEGVPDLVVEVLSPSSWSYDRNEKFRVYQTAGVPEYWMVDYRVRTVEVFVLETANYALLGKWNLGEMVASHVLAGFTLSVDEVFRDLPADPGVPDA